MAKKLKTEKVKPKRSLTTRDGEARELDANFFSTAKPGRPKLPPALRKTRVTIMLDPDVIDAAKADGAEGWQTRLNAAARRGFRLHSTRKKVAKKVAKKATVKKRRRA
ncbi:MAG: BrnA antitoxin family protein [Pseudomonadota bacterium]